MMENEIEQMNINLFNLLVSEPFTTCLLDLVMSVHQHVSVHSSFCVDTWKHLQPRFSLIVSKASVANDIHDDLKEFERYVSNWVSRVCSFPSLLMNSCLLSLLSVWCISHGHAAKDLETPGSSCTCIYSVIWIYVSSCSGDWCRDDPKTRKRRDAPENAKTGREIMIKTIGENPKARKWEKCKQEPKIWKLENWKKKTPMNIHRGGLASRFKVIKWFPHVSTIKWLGTAWK